MKIIPTRIHGILDYLVSVVLIAAPWLLGFARGGAETWVPVVLGMGSIVYSLLTNYELGASKKLSMRSHLNLDLLSGAFLAISPWLFGFNEYVYMPHLIFGILEISVALLTDPVPANLNQTTTAFTDQNRRHAH
jgi:hypothetical protein